MAKYIDSAELENRIQLIECGVLNIPIRAIFDDVARSCHGADVVPVIHAKWIITSDGICRCTVCGNGIGKKNKYYPFCHWCGAKMDKED